MNLSEIMHVGENTLEELVEGYKYLESVETENVLIWELLECLRKF